MGGFASHHLTRKTVAQKLLMPPSITSSLPTVNFDSSEAMKTTALAISEGSPQRPGGRGPGWRRPSCRVRPPPGQLAVERRWYPARADRVDADAAADAAKRRGRWEVLTVRASQALGASSPSSFRAGSFMSGPSHPQRSPRWGVCPTFHRAQNRYAGFCKLSADYLVRSALSRSSFMHSDAGHFDGGRTAAALASSARPGPVVAYGLRGVRRG